MSPRLVLPLLAVLLVALLLASLCIGIYPVSIPTTVRIIGRLLWPAPMPAAPPWSEAEAIVIELVRLPRVVLAALAGMELRTAPGRTLRGGDLLAIIEEG